jgi:DNA invertase Pin-like site-specific DNA recombinase
MADAAQHRFDCVVVWKLDRFGRSVLNLNQMLARLESYGVRFIAASQGIDTDASNPVARLTMQILASVAEFEREIIRERTLSGVHAARAAGKTLGRPKRVFRRDEVARLRESGLSWRAVAKELGVPVRTCMDAYRAVSECTEIVSSESPVSGSKRGIKQAA